MKLPIVDFHRQADTMAAADDYRAWLRKALQGYSETRAATEARFQDWQGARQLASGIKWESLEQLDGMLSHWADKLTARGVQVHWAADGRAAVQHILDIAGRRGARRVVKSKCMTSEEIHLNDALEASGIEVVESDLGEFIVQLRKEAPYHFVFPAMHLKREEIVDTFVSTLGEIDGEAAEELTMTARRVLRQKYLDADIGITGVNFAVAESGMISITENEGNARLTTAVPPVHIALMGIEKLVPRVEDLGLMLPMLATAGTGQQLTGYNTLLSGPRRPEEVDGPEEVHIVVLDNGRSDLLADVEQRDALRCIRCGACLNVCPIFTNVGGHTYGTTYQGPIGSVITPHLRGLDAWNHLAYASSLCGACTETCPVRIDLHHHLLRIRRNAVRKKPKLSERFGFGAFAWMMRRPRLYRFAGRVGRWFIALTRPLAGTWVDPMRVWRKTRQLPPGSGPSFTGEWQRRRS